MKISSLLFLCASSALTLICGSLVGSAFAADEVGYWRFENSSDLGQDASGAGVSLEVKTRAGGAAPAGDTPFTNPIPQTGESNLGALKLTMADRQFLITEDVTAFDFQSFTIEAYVMIEEFNRDNPALIAGQWDIGLPNGAGMTWLLYVSNRERELSLRLGTAASDGTAYAEIPSGFVLEPNKPYFVATSVDFGSATGSPLVVTFYFKDLSADGSLESRETTSASVRRLNANTATPFAVGTMYENASPLAYRTFSGVIDEVRLTPSVLSAKQLLASPSK